MKIEKAVFSAGKSAYFFDDQKAIKSGLERDGFIYKGKPVTPGFSRVRQAGEAILIQLLVANGMVAVGDCTAVQYSGAGGRDPLFSASKYIPLLSKEIAPLLEGKSFTSFREASGFFDSLEIKGKRLHTALRYGLSQALLQAFALSQKVTPCEIVCREWKLPLPTAPVPLFAQSGDERYTAVDKMIIKEISVLPHALINNIPEKLGRRGGKLRQYISWLAKRIKKLRQSSNYQPILHIDVYGTIGIIFQQDCKRVACYLDSLAEAAEGMQLYIEGPVDMGARESQIAALGKLRQELSRLGSLVKIVADEWCNTLEDIKAFCTAGCCHMVQIKTPDLGCIHNIVDSVLFCRQKKIEAYQGGTCNETDLSARCCVHLALASRPAMMLVKPGMGFDAGYNIVYNEMQRTLDLLKWRKSNA